MIIPDLNRWRTLGCAGVAAEVAETIGDCGSETFNYQEITPLKNSEMYKMNDEEFKCLPDPSDEVTRESKDAPMPSEVKNVAMKERTIRNGMLTIGKRDVDRIHHKHVRPKFVS
ncbi:9739_t:CDS:2, partial [Racocetra fulgida]